MPDPADQTCHSISQSRDEPLIGTAPKVTRWILIECAGPMGRDALLESSMPDAVKTHLQTISSSQLHTRVQLVKSRSTVQDGVVWLHDVHACETEPYYVSLKLDHYEALLDVDLDALESQTREDSVKRQQEPFYLVCTNGKRDPCCARYGLSLYNELREVAIGQVWESSHVGGHRFAPNVVVLPFGIYYGRVHKIDVGELSRAATESQIMLDRYRGRACYDKAVQAADAILRRQTGQSAINRYHFDDLTWMDDEHIRVKFQDRKGPWIHQLDLIQSISDDIESISCRDATLSPVIRYSLVEYKSFEQE